jgi:1A family penicillin-binding protein
MIKHWLTRHQRVSKTISYSVFTFLTVIIMCAVGLTTATWVFSYQLPNPDHLSDRDLPQTTTIYDRNGQLLYEVYDNQKRTLTKLSDLPPNLIHATLAAEDANFYHHGGVDPKGLLNAIYQNIVIGNTIGGSTITQQLVKNALLTNQRTLTRKIQEAILSVQIEKQYSKDQILQMYLNEIPYGGQVYGVEAAARTYFGLPATQLDLAQSALIAGLPQSPTQYSPFEHPDAAIERQHYVLYLMQKAGFITAQQESDAKNEPLHFASSQTLLRAPWFTLWVKDQLIQQYGAQMVEEGGLKVTTSLDLNKQQIAEQEVGYQIDRLKQGNANASQAALLSLDPKTGEILAMVGSDNYYGPDGQVNGTLSPRQPGSSIKPFVYLTAFEQHQITPATVLSDIPTSFYVGPGQAPFVPQESDQKFWGPIMAHDALANSRNIPTVEVMQKIGVPALIDTATKAGITTYTDPSQYGLSLSLGAGEVKMLDLADAYATLATGGTHRNPVAILKVETADGKVLQQYTPSTGTQVFNPAAVYQITNILSDNIARQRLFGPNNLLQLPNNRPAAVKTGTTNDNKDAWTAGYTPSLVTVVWVGNFDNTPMNGIEGATGATPIWHYFMDRALQGSPIEHFIQPSGLMSLPITSTGQYSCGGDFYRNEFFLPGTELTKNCAPIPTDMFGQQSSDSATPFDQRFQKFIDQMQKQQQKLLDHSAQN